MSKRKEIDHDEFQKIRKIIKQTDDNDVIMRNKLNRKRKLKIEINKFKTLVNYHCCYHDDDVNICSIYDCAGNNREVYKLSNANDCSYIS